MLPILNLEFCEGTGHDTLYPSLNMVNAALGTPEDLVGLHVHTDKERVDCAIDSSPVNLSLFHTFQFVIHDKSSAMQISLPISLLQIIYFSFTTKFGFAVDSVNLSLIS
jgi:hypothetical protein